MVNMNNTEIIQKKYAEAIKGINEEWFTTVDSKWYSYIINLPFHLRSTYLIVVFHNQIYNGGFHQFFVNGYGQFAKETINVLIKIGALNKAELLKKALHIVNSDNKSDEVFRKELLNKDIKSLFVEDFLFESLDKLDTQYYALEKEDLEKLLCNYLQCL